MKFAGSWSDLGDWSAVAGELLHDDESNLINGSAKRSIVKTHYGRFRGHAACGFGA